MPNLSAGAAVFTAFLSLLLSSSPVKGQTATADANRKPVVVELFTSEGCSSCPPADLLLQKLVQQQPIADAQIIAFEEHVDYWNHDGWVDPFSSPGWTERQQDYVTLNQQGPYTPELVVDGRSQFVGNDPKQVVVEIEKAAAITKTEVAIAPEKPEAKSSRRFTVSVGKLAGSNRNDVAEVWLAVTEDGLHSSVSRGENSGHVLQHVATLRSLQKIGKADPNGATVSFSGNPLVKFDSHWNPENLHVTVFLQNKKNKEILGAASTRITG